MFGRYKKRTFSLQLSVFGKWSFFRAHSKSPNTTIIGVSAGTGENPKWHFWLHKGHFGKGPRQGVLLSVIPKSCALLKTLYVYCFQQNTALQTWKIATCKKNRILPKTGVVCQNAKSCFWSVSFVFWWSYFFSSLFLCLCFVKRPKKGYFLAIWDVFLNFVPPRGLSLKSFFSSYSVFFLGFPFVPPFKIPFFLCFLSINPFFENILIWGFFYFSFSCLSLSYCLLFFETNFPNIPFLTQVAFILGRFFFFCCFCFVFIVYVSAFLFLFWFCFW